jgi:Mn-dependent DtxR family transcriptional regulator
MPDECLLQLYEYLTEEGRRAFDTLGPLETATMERIMLVGQLTTQQTRKAVWGLASTGLIIYQPGLPVRLSENGARLVKLLAQRQNV